MAATNLDHSDLAAVVLDGWIAEDTLRAIFDISPVDRPVIDAIGSDMTGNKYTSWLEDKLRAADPDNAVVDGSDAPADGSSVGTRVGNWTQIAQGTLHVSTSAREADNIGYADALAYQVEKEQKAIWTDTEASILSLNASVEDDGAAAAGKSAGLEAWLETHTVRGALGADGGFGTTTADIVDAATPGTKLPLAESDLKDMMQGVYESGGEVTLAVMRAPVKRLMSEFFYTDGAKTALMRAEVGQDRGMDVAKGNVELWVSDFGTVAFVPDRSLQTTATATSTLFLIDPEFLRMGYLYNLRGEPIGKKGLSDIVQLSHEFTLKVLNRDAHALIADIDEALPMLAVPA